MRAGKSSCCEVNDCADLQDSNHLSLQHPALLTMKLFKYLPAWLCLLTLIQMTVESTSAQQHAYIPHGVGHSKTGMLDLMDPRNFTLGEYRQMYLAAPPATPQEMLGAWRGVNKGGATLAGYRQFIKEFQQAGCTIVGENIEVNQIPSAQLRQRGWQPKFDSNTGQLERDDRFLVKPADNFGFFGRGTLLSYRDGANKPLDAIRLLVDRVVKIDDDHLLGRATVRTVFGPVPVAYFMLERVR